MIHACFKMGGKAEVTYFGNISATHILNVGTSQGCMVNFLLCLPFLLGKWFIVPVGTMLDVVQNSFGCAENGKTDCFIVGLSYHHMLIWSGCL